MYLIDFKYDGKSLSDYNSVVGYYESSPESNVELSTPLTLNTVRVGQRFKITSAIYEQAYTAPITFVKNPCVSDVYYTEEEINNILRWLKGNRVYRKFKPIYDDNSFADVYLMGVFTEVHTLSNGIGVVGFELTLETDSPYGHLEDVVLTLDLSGSGSLGASLPDGVDTILGKYHSYLNDASMECWYVYPRIEIECLDSGKLEIFNTMFPNESTVIDNCSAGEIILFSGETKQIESSQPLHIKLYNDFNYKYPRIGNTIDSTNNTFSSSLKAKMKITYSPMTFVTLL